MLVVETLIAVAIAVTTAFGGLVADDVFSVDDSCTVTARPDLWAHHCTSQARLAWFLGSAALLVGAMWARHWLINRNGTLYYLRLLPATSPDRMRGAIDLARARSLDFRTATGWFGIDGDFLDIRTDVNLVTDELERAMNDDDEGTGYLFAPNLVFPAALAVGYDALLRQRTHLCELPEQARSGRRFGGDTGIRTVFFDDGYTRWSDRDWVPHHAHPDPEITLTTLGDPTSDPTAVRRVWLSLQLGPQGPVTEVDAAYPLRRACDVVVVAGPTETVNGEPRLRAWQLPTLRRLPGGDSRRIDPTAFARILEELSGAVEHVLDEYPGAQVLLAADVPHTVAFALGYVISERKDAYIHGTLPAHPGSRLDSSPAGCTPAQAETDGLSSLNRFWESVTPVLIQPGEAIPALVHAAQIPDSVPRSPRSTMPGHWHDGVGWRSSPVGSRAASMRRARFPN